MTLLRRVFGERRAVLVPLVVFLAGNMAVLALVVWPLQRAVAGADEARYQAVIGLETAKKLEAHAKAQRTSKERADGELKKFYGEILPKDHSGAIKIANFWLGRVAEESRITFRSGQWDREDVRESRLMKVKGQVTLIGEYANIRRFLYEVETAQEFVIIESVELSQASATQNDSLLELSLAIATYYLTNAPTGAVAR